MAFEIELKAWVDDHKALKERLGAISRFEGEYLKEDCYWFPKRGAKDAEQEGALPLSGLRVRKEALKAAGGETERLLVTYKTKERREGEGGAPIIEVNSEHEFLVCAVDDGKPACKAAAAAIDEFEGFLKLCSLEAVYTKTKKGFAFKALCGAGGKAGSGGECGAEFEAAGEINAELSFVEKLGWFLELEIIAAQNDAQTVKTAREKLLAFLNQAGIPEEKIETRYYSEMLAALK